jgi:DNA polymerase III subunit delta'
MLEAFLRPQQNRTALIPCSFMQRILGQSRAVQILQASLRTKRVHHAWIFGGPAGVGKYTTAIEFARTLLDPNAAPTLAGGIEADPDSRSSQLLDAGTHPDLHSIRKELAAHSSDPEVRKKKQSNIPIDVIREFMIGGLDEASGSAPAYRTAVMGHGKVFIIDEAELVDHTSQNAILKTLEEPPRETYIVLVTSRPDRLLATIRSRCQYVPFVPLDQQAMSTWFERHGPKLDGKELAWIESFADGSPGTALLAAEYGFYQWRQTLAPMLVAMDRGAYPATMGETMASLIDEFASAWVKNHKNASKDAANKAGARHMLAMLARYARNGLAAAVDAGRDPERWMEAANLLREAERQLYSNVNQKMVLENLVAQWSQRTARVAAAQ